MKDETISDKLWLHFILYSDLVLGGNVKGNIMNQDNANYYKGIDSFWIGFGLVHGKIHSLCIFVSKVLLEPGYMFVICSL